jgi:hypothetical protein
MKRNTLVKLSKKPGILVSVLTILMVSALPGTASAVSVVNIDGVYNPGDDFYNQMATVEWWNDHHSQFGAGDPSRTTTMRWINNMDGLYVYGGVSLEAKNMIWGDGVTPAEVALYYQGWCDAPADGAACTHHNKDGVGGNPNSGTEQLVLDYDRAVKSEKFVLASTGLEEKKGKSTKAKAGKSLKAKAGKIEAKGGIVVDLGQYPAGNTKTSVDWVIANRGCDTTNCDASDIPMSFEKLFTDAAEKMQILSWLEDWQNGGAKPAVGLIAHLSPERGGVVGDIPPVPVPAAFWLFGTALVGFIGISRKRTLG